MTLPRSVLQSLPKVLLHEHLDGVLRPRKVIELAESTHYTDLPTNDAKELAEWFHQGANQGSLAKYLEGFRHTIAVMQTEEALERVAYEQAEDLSRDGVIFYETRFAPIFHTHGGLTHQQVVSAVLRGMARGRQDFGICSGLIICAMRNMNVSLDGGTGGRLPRAWSRWFRSGWRRRRVSPEETCGCFSLHPERELQYHDSCGGKDLVRNRSGKRSSTAGRTASATARA